MARKKLITVRKGTAAEWTSANPILALGELGLETDTHKLKGGDGTTTWSSLAYITDGGGGGGSSAWGGITGTLSAQADLQAALDAKADDSQITSLQTQIDGKQAFGSYASSTHSHAMSDITGLAAAISGLAPTAHTHVIANVTGLQAALDAKQASGSYANASHTHAISDVTGLSTALDAKQATITVGTTAPASPTVGMLWVDTN